MLRRIQVLFIVLIAMMALAACGGVAQVDMSDLQTYKPTSGVYSIDVPKAWKLADQSTPGAQQAMWTDANNNALIFVSVSPAGSATAVPTDVLGTGLQAALKAAFGTQPGFKMSDPAPQTDGSVRVTWSYDANADNSAKVTLSGNSFMEQRGDKLGILMTALPATQADTLKDAHNQVLNSFKIDESAQIP